MSFNPNSSLDLNALWDNLGTFYTMVEPDSKETIQTYWQSLMDGLEGLHYDLAQSHLSPYLEHSKGYLEDNYRGDTIHFGGTLSNVELESYKAPITASGTIATPIVSGQSMEYRVTTLYNYGESLPTDSIIINSGVDYINAAALNSNPVTISWSGVSGADGYNIYGRGLGRVSLIGTSTTTTFIDSGVSIGSQERPAPEPIEKQTDWIYNENPTFLPTEGTAFHKHIYQYASENEQYLSIPFISGVNTKQVLVENDDYEISNTTKVTFNKRLHKTKFSLSGSYKIKGHPNFGSGNNRGIFIDSQQAPKITMVRGYNYIFDVTRLRQSDDNSPPNFFLFSDKADPANSIILEGSANTLRSFVPTNATPNKIYYGTVQDPTAGYEIDIIDTPPKTGVKHDWLLVDPTQGSIGFREDFITLNSYKVLPSLTQIYLKAFGSSDPQGIVNSGVYEPFLSGWATGEIEYTEKRKLYGEHLKKWCHAMVTSSKKPPSLVNLERIYSLTKGFPFTYHDGKVDTITESGDYNYIHILGSGSNLGITDTTYMIDKEMTLNYEVGSYVDRHNILVSGINFYDRNKDLNTISGIMQREGEIYEYDVFPKQIAPKNIELWPYPADVSHFVRPKVLSTSLISEALTNVQKESDIYIPPAPDDVDPSGNQETINDTESGSIY